MLQAITLLLGVALWSAGTSLRRQPALSPWMPATVLTAGGYIIVVGLALALKAGLAS